MDPLRQVRWLIPPFFLLASLVLGAHLGCVLDYSFFQSEVFTKNTTAIIAALIAILTATVLPLGFLISSISIQVLRLIFFISNGLKPRNYEAVLSDETWERIWRKLGPVPPRTEKLSLYAAATFDHELLPPGIHEWLFRRWTTFNVSFHSSSALLLAYIIGRVIGIPRTISWEIITSSVVLLLLVNAIVAWRQTMAMIEFQSHRIGVCKRKVNGLRCA